MSTPPTTFLRDQLAALAHRDLYAPTPPYTEKLDEILERWFGGTRWKANGTRFTLLATDKSGGMYCLWHYPELGDKSPPVVYLGSQGNGLSVIANTTVDFIEVLASGNVWWPKDGYVADPGRADAAKLAAFAERARRDYQLTGHTAQAILDEGRANHPDFAAWVDRHTD